MKRFLLVLLTSAALVICAQPIGAKGHTASHSKSAPKTSKKPATSKKSSKPGSNDGTYVGGQGGSSHKGGHYKNPTTNDKERNRKAGTPK
jgi:uncharacterized protein with FMN-binding domain